MIDIKVVDDGGRRGEEQRGSVVVVVSSPVAACLSDPSDSVDLATCWSCQRID